MKIYNVIIGGCEMEETDVLEWVNGIDWSAEEFTDEQTVSAFYDQYITTTDGIEVWYNTTADYYFFVQA